MKFTKTSVTILVAAMFVIGTASLVVVGQQGTQTEEEPNDIGDTPDSIEVGTPVSGAIEGANDTDRFSFPLENNTVYRVSVTIAEESDTPLFMRLQNPNQSPLTGAFPELYRPGETFTETVNTSRNPANETPPGTYVLKVSPVDPSAPTSVSQQIADLQNETEGPISSPYTLTVEVISDGDAAPTATETATPTPTEPATKTTATPTATETTTEETDTTTETTTEETDTTTETTTEEGMEIDHIAIEPVSSTVSVGNATELNVTFRDASGDILNVTRNVTLTTDLGMFEESGAVTITVATSATHGGSPAHGHVHLTSEETGTATVQAQSAGVSGSTTVTFVANDTDGDGGDGKAKQPRDGDDGAADGGNGKSKMGDGGAGDDTADGGNGKAKSNYN